MTDFQLSLNDVLNHVVTIGLDVYPPIEMKDERTRLNMFYEDACERWQDLYEQMTVGESEFKISKLFRKKPGVQGPTHLFDTFVLTQRGPVFIFPLRLPDPVGFTNWEGRFREIFSKVRSTFWSLLPGHTIIKAGLVREVIFSVGDTDCTFLVSTRSNWLGSQLKGGQRLVHYRDEKYNIRLELSPGKIGKTTVLPVGTKVEQPVGFGLKVRLDVNNAEVRPLQDADIEEVIDRALAFWPDELLEYIAGVET